MFDWVNAYTVKVHFQNVKPPAHRQNALGFWTFNDPVARRPADDSSEGIDRFWTG
jgi:hypothetical protein